MDVRSLQEKESKKQTKQNKKANTKWTKREIIEWHAAHSLIRFDFYLRLFFCYILGRLVGGGTFVFNFLFERKKKKKTRTNKREINCYSSL